MFDGLGLFVEVESGADADVGKLLHQHLVVWRRRILREHRVEGLEGADRIILGLDRLEDVAMAGAVGVLPPPFAQRRQQVLLLELLDLGHVVGIVVDERPAHHQNRPAGRVSTRLVDVFREVALPARSNDRVTPVIGAVVRCPM